MKTLEGTTKKESVIYTWQCPCASIMRQCKCSGGEAPYQLMLTFPLRKLLVYQSVSYQIPLCWYTGDIMGVDIYIYPSILTYPKLMQIGCINPQVDIMGAELPGYNGCILVYIGIMDV